MIVKVATTEPCPSCDLYIGKEGGCQYMRCPKCTHEFAGFVWDMCQTTSTRMGQIVHIEL